MCGEGVQGVQEVQGVQGESAEAPSSARDGLAPDSWLLSSYSLDFFSASDHRLVSQVRESLEQAVFVVREMLGKDKHH